ncbi:uncharacterized protein LOC107274668 [Cephus cinctus]|uniref:Uncharacterized protein LOC107274668 n=1 Tax=Cephus cinctus TaxID=211228 RepID=A0AAJ7CFE8_CEPCN|nr:uncharacterized protein LOC107274668 [Cephus cinctus]
MASFRSKLKISGALLPQNWKYVAQGNSNECLKNITRNICFGGRSKKGKKISKKKSIEDRPQPSIGCPSKCLDTDFGKPLPKPRRPWFNFCRIKVPKKEKPSNCPKKIIQQCHEESFWDYLFNFETKPRPDPCTCRLAYMQKSVCLQQDPRLCDPRYSMTKGDVLLYTESPKPECCTRREAQPKPPPCYRLPKALTCKLLAEEASKRDNADNASCPKSTLTNTTKVGTMFPQKGYRIPFEELRPRERRKKPFSCKEGIHERDVCPPLQKKRQFGGKPLIPTSQSQDTEINTATPSAPIFQTEDTYDPKVHIKKYSRFEQLQKLTKAKASGKCPCDAPED